MLPNNDLGPWAAIPPLPTSLFYFGVAVHHNTIYLFGGARVYQYYTDNAFKATIQADGSLSKWSRTTSLPLSIGVFATAQNGDRIYLLGGDSGDGMQDAVYMTRVLPDGQLDTWQQVSTLPLKVSCTGAVAFRGWLYLFSGYQQFADGGEKYRVRSLPCPHPAAGGTLIVR